MGWGHWIVLVRETGSGQGSVQRTQQTNDKMSLYVSFSHPLWPTVPPRVLLPLVGIQSPTAQLQAGCCRPFARSSHCWTAQADLQWDLILLAKSDSRMRLLVARRGVEPSVCQRRCRQQTQSR